MSTPTADGPPLAPVVQRFFAQRLQRQRQVTAATVAAYRDTFRLLLRFAEAHLQRAPAQARHLRRRRSGPHAPRSVSAQSMARIDAALKTAFAERLRLFCWVAANYGPRTRRSTDSRRRHEHPRRIGFPNRSTFVERR